MSDPISIIAIGAAVGGAAGKFAEQAWITGEKWLSGYFRDHAPAAKERARMNSAKFVAELADQIKALEDSENVNRSVIEEAQNDPQFSVILQQAVIGAAQTSDDQKHRLLAELVAARLASPAESTFALAISLACQAVPVLNSIHFRLLALATALHEIRPGKPLPLRLYEVWLKNLLDEVLEPFVTEELTYREIDVLHLSALGCITYDRASNRGLEVVLEMKNGLVDGEIILDFDSFLESDSGFCLKFMWSEGFAGVDLTSVGSVIGGRAFDEIRGSDTGEPSWAEKQES